jgi:hypothetical protein
MKSNRLIPAKRAAHITERSQPSEIDLLNDYINSSAEQGSSLLIVKEVNYPLVFNAIVNHLEELLDAGYSYTVSYTNDKFAVLRWRV